jgi:hypothetical protein
MPQVLVISHNAQPPWEWDPYSRSAFRPVNPVILFGVTGMSSEAPKMPNKHTVMQWWKALLVGPQ